MALKYLKRALRCPKNEWSSSGAERIQCLEFRAEAATIVAKDYVEKGKTMAALSYFKIAREPLGRAGLSNYYGEAYFQAAKLELTLTKPPIIKLRQAAEWFERSATADVSPAHGPNRSSWYDAAQCWWELAGIYKNLHETDPESYQDCREHAFIACCKALDLRTVNPNNRRSFRLDALQGKELDSTRAGALAIIGHCLSEGVIVQEAQHLDMELGALAYDLAYKNGDLDAAAWQLECYIDLKHRSQALALIERVEKDIKTNPRFTIRHKREWKESVEKLLGPSSSSSASSSSSSSSSSSLSSSSTTTTPTIDLVTPPASPVAHVPVPEGVDLDYRKGIMSIAVREHRGLQEADLQTEERTLVNNLRASVYDFISQQRSETLSTDELILHTHGAWRWFKAGKAQALSDFIECHRTDPRTQKMNRVLQGFLAAEEGEKIRALRGVLGLAEEGGERMIAQLRTPWEPRTLSDIDRPAIAQALYELIRYHIGRGEHPLAEALAERRLSMGRTHFAESYLLSRRLPRWEASYKLACAQSREHQARCAQNPFAILMGNPAEARLEALLSTIPARSETQALRSKVGSALTLIRASYGASEAPQEATQVEDDE